MRIGYDAKRMFHNWRGLGNYSRDLVTNLKNFEPNNLYLLYTPPFNDPRAEEFGKNFIPDEIKTPKSFFSRNFPSVWRRNLSKILENDKIELFHGLSHEIPYGLKKRGIKSVVTIHDLIFLRYPEYFPWIDRKIYLSKVKHAVKEADVIIAICEQTKEDLINFLNVKPDKIKICYQTCHSIFQENISDDLIKEVILKYQIDRPYFLYVGALEPRKNLLNLIEGFSYFGSSHDLVIVGRKNDYQQVVLDKIKKCNVDNNVKILNDVPQADLPALYKGAEIFCFPSFFEGFGIPIIEALFSGTPVVTSEGSCFPEVAGKGALYINPDSSFQIGKALYELTSNFELKNRLIREGREHVQKFSSENTVKELFSIYQNLLDS